MAQFQEGVAGQDGPFYLESVRGGQEAEEDPKVPPDAVVTLVDSEAVELTLQPDDLAR